jgi:hypothetical protein
LGRYNNLNQISDISDMAGILTSDYSGVHCADYKSFLSKMSGKSWGDFLLGLEDDVHGKFHFTLGGQGGPYCYSQVRLMSIDFSAGEFTLSVSKCTRIKY